MNESEGSSDSSSGDTERVVRPPPRKKPRQHRAPTSPSLSSLHMPEDICDKNDTTILGSDTDMSTDSDGFPSDLEFGEVWIEYHPESGLPDTVYSASNGAAQAKPVLPHSFANEAPPWHPFSTRENFEQAELFIRYGCTGSFINEQLALNHRAAQETKVTMRNAQELREIMAGLPKAEGHAEYEQTVISVEFPKQEARSYTVHHKPIMPVVQGLLEDERLQDRIDLYPQRRYVARPGGGGVMRVWEEMTSGDDSWNLQTALGSSAFGIYLQVYVDATHVTCFGNVKYWGVYIWLANIPKADRNDPGGLGRATLIGFLPVVDKKRTDKSHNLAQHRALVYHAAFDVILADVKVAAEFGTYLNLKIAYTELKPGRLICVVVSCDYEDMARAAGIKGVHGHFPCPICLVPREELWNLLMSWPSRTACEAKQLLVTAEGEATQKSKKEILNQQSLRPITNIFNEIFGELMSVGQMFVLDPLHQIEQGEWGRHWWSWLLTALPETSLEEIDSSFKDSPRHPGVHHFRNGITELRYITGGEQGQILARISPFLVGHWKTVRHENKVLRALRALAVIHLLTARFRVHTETTLHYLDDEIIKYNNACNDIRSDEDFDIDFNWPKHHLLSHAAELIRRKGPADNYETGLGERLHPQVKQDYKRSNKRETTTDQIMWMAQERDSLLRIRAQVDRYDAFCEALDDQDGINSTEDENEDIRTKLAAPERRRVTMQHLIQSELPQLETPAAVFRKLSQALRHLLGQPITEKELRSCLVRGFRCLHVRFICMMSSQLRVDTIRTNSNWQKQGPRHDCVLIKVGEQEYEFGQVYAFVELTVRTQKLEVAYVRRFKTRGRHPASRYIELEKGGVDMIPVDSIERAVELIPPSSNNKYLTVEDLEPDMYLRLKYTVQ
ncbi:hypothetical protein BD626DRAFT_576598 [Schizophyllum amplum]|uniref:Uncharacterized protein n=1 Tax=Schizophyllum amplum TaxID=97359 RepID=A0A550BTB6_9AGAR|nr:hypothetical protein BD626DRAFT_576598 [Auriculariopsis ampla]